LIKLSEYDIVCVTESWATPLINDSELQIPGYTMYRKDRGTIRDARGGGVLIYINANYVSLINDGLNLFKCETLWIKIITGMNGFFNLGVCYRSPNVPPEEVENLFMVIKEASKH